MTNKIYRLTSLTLWFILFIFGFLYYERLGDFLILIGFIWGVVMIELCRFYRKYGTDIYHERDINEKIN